MQSTSEELTAALDKLTRAIVGEADESPGKQRNAAAQKKFDQMKSTWGFYTHGLEADEIDELAENSLLRETFRTMSDSANTDGTIVNTPHGHLETSRNLLVD